MITKLQQMTASFVSDWKGKMSLLLATVAAGWISGGAQYLQDRAVAFHKLPGIVQAYEAQQKEPNKLDILIKKVDSLDRKLSTLKGEAQIVGMIDDDVIQVNRISEANIFLVAGKVKITNISSPSAPSRVFRIDGTFKNEDEVVLARLSRRAASFLDAGSSTSIVIKMEPVEEVTK